MITGQSKCSGSCSSCVTVMSRSLFKGMIIVLLVFLDSQEVQNFCPRHNGTQLCLECIKRCVTSYQNNTYNVFLTTRNDMVYGQCFVSGERFDEWGKRVSTAILGYVWNVPDNHRENGVQISVS